MTNQDLILNIAVNLGRLGRWKMEGKTERIKQFIEDSKVYLNQLDRQKINSSFFETYDGLIKNFNLIQENLDGDWAEDAFTWANILTHRAKLA